MSVLYYVSMIQMSLLHHLCQYFKLFTTLASVQWHTLDILYPPSTYSHMSPLPYLSHLSPGSSPFPLYQVSPLSPYLSSRCILSLPFLSPLSVFSDHTTNFIYFVNWSLLSPRTRFPSVSLCSPFLDWVKAHPSQIFNHLLWWLNQNVPRMWWTHQPPLNPRTIYGFDPGRLIMWSPPFCEERTTMSVALSIQLTIALSRERLVCYNDNNDDVTMMMVIILIIITTTYDDNWLRPLPARTWGGRHSGTCPWPWHTCERICYRTLSLL